MLLALAITAASSSSLVHAWGNIGHQLTGTIAQHFISPATQAIVNDLIPDLRGNLSASATWADKVKFTGKYAFTRNLHFVDSQDNPPADCNFDQERDCADGKCLTGAIGNYTSRLSCRYPLDQRGDALKFVMHFLGDLTQPLHTCARLRGGNSAKVKFGARSSTDANEHSDKAGLNLHAIWDTNMLEKRIKAAYHNSVPAMAEHLIQMASSAMDTNEASDWTACLQASAGTPMDCAISWTRDSDSLNCGMVWKLYDENPNQDFAGKYYDMAWPIIEKQLVKAGVRAAAWFDANLRSCNA